MDLNETDDLLGAAQQMLAALWSRAMDNDLSIEEVRSLRRGCMAVAIARYGVERVMPFPNWRD